MIASINPTTYSATAEASAGSPDLPGDSQAFRSTLSAASSTQDAASSNTKPSGTVVHDRKVHHHASLNSADTLPASTPVSAPATPPSTLPPMPPTSRTAEAQPKIDAGGSEGFPAMQPEPAGDSAAPQPADGDHSDLPGADDTASQPAAALPTDHEAALRDAIAALQNGSIAANVQPAGQAAFPLAGVPLKGAKGQPTTQAPAAASTVSSTAPDRQHKTAASDDASNTDSSGTSQGNAQDQGSSKTQVADLTLPQDGPLAGHAGPAAALTLDAAPTPVHTSGSVQAAPVQAETVPAAYLAMLQPDAVATPFVSSARLIQSIQQSDMRVGLNSLEFGAISLHSSTDRGVISSEITLGHAELARTISAHLSAMQELPGTPMALSVRVDTGSPTAGDSSGSSQRSPGDKQQQEAGRTTQSRSANLQPRSEYNLPIAARSQDGHDVRLDIRI